MRSSTSLLVLVLAGCAGESGIDAARTRYDSPVFPIGPDEPGPAFMNSARDDVSGQGCAYAPVDLLGPAAGLLDDHWSRTDLTATYGSVDEARLVLAAGGEQADVLALRFALALEQLGVFGQYADLGSAYASSGRGAGVPGIELPIVYPADRSVHDAIGSLLGAFGNCPSDWYLAASIDLDGDGVQADSDCDDLDVGVGMEVDEDDLSAPGGYEPTEQLGPDWFWDGDSVYATQGGQEAMLGVGSSPADIVVIGDIGALGTKIDCGFDCAEACGAYEPDDCYTAWQAIGLGILTVDMLDEVVTYHNSGEYDVCLDAWLVFDADSDSQSHTLGPTDGSMGGGTYRIPAHGSLQTYYGSHTTANDTYEPHAGEIPYWCIEYGATLVDGATYFSTGALTPEDIRMIITESSDVDGDGVEDHLDWTGHSGVQTQYSVWDYQETHAMVLVGKVATTAPGIVRSTVDLVNRGGFATTATVTDTVPDQWSLVSCDDAPDTIVENADGTTTLTWSVDLAGCTDDCSDVETWAVTCDLVSTLHVDRDIVELPAATATFFDSEDDETSSSLPAAAFDYDHDGDGAVVCGATDRWRVGVLARATADADQNEGYHAFRCALASNSPYDCFPEGPFLQIGAFLDGPEDGVQSECEDGCPVNTTFDQLARVDHDGTLDVSSGDRAQLRFYAVGDELVCEAWDPTTGALAVQARAASALFATGGYGVSTLNMFGDFDHLKVCEAYAAP